MDPLGAVRMGVQTADKNITIRNKSSSRCFNFKPLLNYEYFIMLLSPCSKKVVLYESGEKYAQIKLSLEF